MSGYFTIAVVLTGGECIIMVPPMIERTADDRLNNHMSYLNWSQATLARKLGIHRNTVSRWMNGKSEVPGYARRFVWLAVLIKELAEEIEP